MPAPWFVSVVVPVLNGEATIADCLEALLRQGYPRASYEIIVVDNGSIDRTPEIVRRHPVTLLMEHGIRTSYAARNRGARFGKGELVAFLDADCIADPNWLAELVKPFDLHDCGASLGAILDAPSRNLCQEFSAAIKPFARPDQCRLRTLLTANVAVRRSTFDALRGFRDRLPTAGDVDFGWRIQLHLGLQLIEAEGATVRHVHRSTPRGVFVQFQRYGVSEILLTTLYRGEAGSTTPAAQVHRMLRQLRACCSYVASFALRAAQGMLGRRSRRELAWPLFLLLVESGNLAGKVRGLLATRGYRRNPFPSDDAAEPAGTRSESAIG